MKDGCIHNQLHNHCDKYGYLCNGSAEKKAKCPEWGIVKAYEDSLTSITQKEPYGFSIILSKEAEEARKKSETRVRIKSLSEAAEEAYKELGRT